MGPHAFVFFLLFDLRFKNKKEFWSFCLLCPDYVQHLWYLQYVLLQCEGPKKVFGHLSHKVSESHCFA